MTVQSLHKCECVTPDVLDIKRIILFGHLFMLLKHQPLSYIIVHVVRIHSQEGVVLSLFLSQNYCPFLILLFLKFRKWDIFVFLP